jgi:hypothetical protein
VRLNYLPGDRVTDSHRSYQQLNTEWDLPASWRVRLAAENVSDVHYFEDFAEARRPPAHVLPGRISLMQRRRGCGGAVLRLRTVGTAA